jgi:glycosyltransferase involved in cell wall biosynthesis
MTKLKSKIIHIKTKILTTKPIDDHSDYFFKKYNKENKKIILMIGEIYACKNPQLFIDIYNKTKKENNNLFFIWIGDGKNLVQWKKFIKTKSYQNILFPGSLPHKTTMGILSKAQLLLATSVTEAFPLYILEAFMLKTPVLCNSYPTVSDIIENQKNAITFKFNDAQDASEKLLELVSDQSLQNKLTINAKNFFLENHANIKDFSEEHVKVYQEVSS